MKKSATNKQRTLQKKVATKRKDKTQLSSENTTHILSKKRAKRKREGATEPGGELTIRVKQLTAREFAKQKDGWARKYLFGSEYLERPEFKDADTNPEVYEAMLDTMIKEQNLRDGWYYEIVELDIVGGPYESHEKALELAQWDLEQQEKRVKVSDEEQK